METIKISGFVVLFSGVAVLLFTFFNAYLFLLGALEIPVSTNLIAAFGEALAPLIQMCIRAVYLGIMGWIGSILTRRGVQIITVEKEETKPKDKKAKTEAQAEKEQPKEQAEAQG